MARRVAFDDEAMWEFLGCVVQVEGGDPCPCGPHPDKFLVEMERAGWLWLRPRNYGYWIQPSPEGAVAVHRWAARQAKEAALKFGAG